MTTSTPADAAPILLSATAVMFLSLRPQAFATRIIGVLLLLLLAGCSSLKLGYHNAPALSYWWLDSYVDFSDRQAQAARESLASLHDWHRRQELPAYADLLGRLQPLAAGPVTPELVCTFVGEVRLHLQRLGAQAAPGLARVAPLLAPAQLQHLAQQFDKHNQTWREEWLDGTAEELLARRLERTVDRFESFYGRLSPAQQQLLRQRLAASGFDARLAWAERLRRQQDTLRVLRQHQAAGQPAQALADMQALVQRSLEPADPAARAQFERMLQEGCQTMAALHNSADAGQRRRLIERLQGYEADLRALAAEP